jgi:hypothetical protein
VKLTVDLRRIARRDFDDVAAWYETQRTGLGSLGWLYEIARKALFLGSQEPISPSMAADYVSAYVHHEETYQKQKE